MRKPPVPPLYAEIPDAYLWGELIMDTPGDDDPESCFALLRKSRAPLAEVINILAGLVEADDGEGGCIKVKTATAILAQMTHPRWRDYVAAKLGMM